MDNECTFGDIRYYRGVWQEVSKSGITYPRDELLAAGVAVYRTNGLRHHPIYDIWPDNKWHPANERSETNFQAARYPSKYQMHRAVTNQIDIVTDDDRAEAGRMKSYFAGQMIDVLNNTASDFGKKAFKASTVAEFTTSDFGFVAALPEKYAQFLDTEKYNTYMASKGSASHFLGQKDWNVKIRNGEILHVQRCLSDSYLVASIRDADNNIVKCRIELKYFYYYGTGLGDTYIKLIPGKKISLTGRVTDHHHNHHHNVSETWIQVNSITDV